MVIEAIVIGGLGYVTYREYKSGKLTADVAALKTKFANLESAAKAEASKVAAAVVADVKKVL